MDSLQDSIRRAASVTRRPSVAPRPVPPTAERIMVKDVLVFRESDPIQKAMQMLVKRGFSGAPVVDEHGRIVGILSELDCMKLVASNSFHQEGATLASSVGDLMSREIRTIEPNTDLFAIAHKFMVTRTRRFPVLSGEVLVGLVSRRDVLRAMQEYYA